MEIPSSLSKNYPYSLPSTGCPSERKASSTSSAENQTDALAKEILFSEKECSIIPLHQRSIFNIGNGSIPHCVITTSCDGTSAYISDIFSEYVSYYTQQHHQNVLGIAIDEPMGRVFTGSFGGTLCIHDYETGECLHYFQEPHSTGFQSLLYMGNDRLVSGPCRQPFSRMNSEWDYSMRCWLISEMGPQLLSCFAEEHRLEITSLISCNNLIYSASGDSNIRSWDSEKMDCSLSSLHGHDSTIYSLSSFNQQFVSAAKDKKILLWDSRTNKKEGEFCMKKQSEAHLQSVYKVDYRFSPLMVSCSRDGTIKCWDDRIQIEPFLTLFSNIGFPTSVTALSNKTIVAGTAGSKTPFYQPSLIVFDT